jgi:hypothetical protein
MNRLSVVAAKRAVIGAGVLLVTLAMPRVAMAQDAAAQADPLKFAANKPTVVGWVVRADKAADFEDGWKSIRELVAKSDKDDLKAFGKTLSEFYKIEQPPFGFPVNGQNVMAVIYLFRLESPSTSFSYNPRAILYEYLKAGQDGAVVNRADADAIYKKLQDAFLTINPLWTLTKIGG